ncbi:MAG: TVP38/TMEM64 family protein [Sporanaerobacter sp.]|uniref:TVP38/TMEM64 family protein n=1 Tax=Sporanaerobacter sp. TaxID=2010183 RepID=UPI003A0FEA5C
MKNIKKSTWVKIGVIVGLICVYLFVTPVRTSIEKIVSLFGKLDVEAIKEYILSFGIWAPIISFLLMVFQSVAAPLPAFLITFANASLFGWVKGALLSWSSAMAGATLCFYIARIYGRNTAEKLTSKFALEEIDKFFDKYGDYAILIARLLPFISFDIVSYAAGLTAMGFWSFFWATGLGQLPATLVYSYVGGMLTGGTKKFVFGLLILFSLSILIYLMKRIWNDRNSKKIANNAEKIEKN